MPKKYALHDNNEIKNIIVADSLETAQTISNFDAFEITERVEIGWQKVGEHFIPQKPYPSWVLREDGKRWIAPVPQIDSSSVWDEASLSWIEPTDEE